MENEVGGKKIVSGTAVYRLRMTFTNSLVQILQNDG